MGTDYQSLVVGFHRGVDHHHRHFHTLGSAGAFIGQKDRWIRHFQVLIAQILHKFTLSVVAHPHHHNSSDQEGQPHKGGSPKQYSSSHLSPFWRLLPHSVAKELAFKAYSEICFKSNKKKPAEAGFFFKHF